MPLPAFQLLEPLVPQFVLTFFRVAGLMLFAPLFGSARIPRRVKLLLALVMSIAMFAAPQRTSAVVGQDIWMMTLAIAGELLTGVAMGMVVSLVFIAAQWAGEIIGQQVGFSMTQAFDPQFGSAGSVVGDAYFTLSLAIFLLIGGHRVLVDGVFDSLHHVPPGALIFSDRTLEIVLHFVTDATTLALRLAAPVFVTMLIVDVAMGFLSKTMPQFNVMTAGLTLRSLVGMLLLILGLIVVSEVLADALGDALRSLPLLWRTS